VFQGNSSAAKADYSHWAQFADRQRRNSPSPCLLLLTFNVKKRPVDQLVQPLWCTLPKTGSPLRPRLFWESRSRYKLWRVLEEIKVTHERNVDNAESVRDMSTLVKPRSHVFIHSCKSRSFTL